MKEFSNLGLAIICLMISNISLGVTLAQLKSEFKKEKLWPGVVKILGIIIGIAAMFVAGHLTTDIIVANINGQDVNILFGLKLIMIAIITWYGCENLRKIVNLFKLKMEVVNK